MTPTSRRDFLNTSVASLAVLASASAWGDDATGSAPVTVHDDITSAARGAALSMRFAGDSPESVRTWREAFSRQLNLLLGDSTPPSEWSEIEESRVELHDHVRLELLLRAAGVPDLPVYLLLPRIKGDAKPAPAVVCVHGHGAFGHHPVVGRTDLPGVAEAIAGSRYDYGLQFVRRGYVVAAPCLIPFGRRLDPGGYGGDDPCAVTFVRMQALGMLPITSNLRDCRWAISLLQRRGEVNPDRSGCAGLSYGGRMTMLTAAVDERVAAAAISGALNLMQERIQHRYSCGSQIIPGLLQYGDHPEISGLIAPRLCIFEVGRQDKLIRSPYAEDFRSRVKSIYQAAGADDRLHFDDFDGGHRWNGAVSSAVFDDALRT